MQKPVNVLVVHIGGTHVKALATGQKPSREFPSGPKLTPRQMVAGVKKLASDREYHAISIGYPGVVMGNRPVADPYNLGQGWAGFDFEAAFKRPIKATNYAAMQALGRQSQQCLRGRISCLAENPAGRSLDVSKEPSR